MHTLKIKPIALLVVLTMITNVGCTSGDFFYLEPAPEPAIGIFLGQYLVGIGIAGTASTTATFKVTCPGVPTSETVVARKVLDGPAIPIADTEFQYVIDETCVIEFDLSCVAGTISYYLGTPSMTNTPIPYTGPFQYTQASTPGVDISLLCA